MKIFRVAAFGSGALFLFIGAFQIPSVDAILLTLPGLWMEWND